MLQEGEDITREEDDEEEEDEDEEEYDEDDDYEDDRQRKKKRRHTGFILEEAGLVFVSCFTRYSIFTFGSVHLLYF